MSKKLGKKMFFAVTKASLRRLFNVGSEKVRGECAFTPLRVDLNP